MAEFGRRIPWWAWVIELIDVTGYGDPCPTFVLGDHVVELWGDWEWSDE